MKSENNQDINFLFFRISINFMINPNTVFLKDMTKDPISRALYTLIILHFIYCDMILDRNNPVTLVSGSFKIRIN